MPKAHDKHILLHKQNIAKKLKKEILNQEISFEKAAKRYSKCPSGKDGGDLGEFNKGDMVKEFDKVVFTCDLNRIHGPIKTEFGFHLIQIISRS